MVFEYSVELFEYTWIFVLEDCAAVASGDHFSVRAPDISGYWYSTWSIWGVESSVRAFYKLFRIRLLVCVKLFLDHITQEEDPAFANLNLEASVLPVRRDVNMKVSTVSWKPKAVVIERFVVRHKSENFYSQFFSTNSKILDFVQMRNWSAILMTYSK